MISLKIHPSDALSFREVAFSLTSLHLTVRGLILSLPSNILSLHLNLCVCVCVCGAFALACIILRSRGDSIYTCERVRACSSYRAHSVHVSGFAAQLSSTHPPVALQGRDLLRQLRLHPLHNNRYQEEEEVEKSEWERHCHDA